VNTLIARIWRGWTRPEDTDAYAAYIQATGLAEYTAIPGNRGAYLLHRPDGDRTEFLAVSLWADLESISAFAGDDINAAVFYPEDDRLLIDRETTVNHYAVTEPVRSK
jgi:heme-degrading monooxygenase HmoA